MPGRRRHSDEDRAKGRRLGAAIASARISAGLTQQDLATRASLAISTLRRIEAGRTPDPGWFTVLGLARELRVPVDELLAASEASDG